MHLEWAIPSWGWIVLALAGIAAVLWARRQYRASQPPLPAGLRAWLIVLRSTALLLLLLAVAGPSLDHVWQQQRPAEVAVILEDSGSMALADGPAGEPRWEVALRLAQRTDSLLRRSAEPVQVTLLRGNGEQPLRDLEQSSAAARPPEAVGTDLSALLREISARWADRPLRGVVLLSDGNETVTDPQLSAPRVALGAASFLAVGLGDPVGPADRFVQDVRYPEVAFQGDEVVAEVTVGDRHAAGVPAAPITVQLRAGQQVVAETTSVAEPEGGTTRLELTWRPATAGFQVYDLVVLPFDNERYLDNNMASLAIDVRKDRSHLLLLAGRPGWDVRFLAQAARNEERLDLTVAYRSAAGLVLADSAGTWQAPVDAAGWRKWDGIVLIGWDDLREDVPWESLRQAVTNGMGLWVIIGDTDGGERPWTRLQGPPSALAELLPVRLDDARLEPGEWLPEVVPAAAAHSILAGVTHQVEPGMGLGSGSVPPLTRVLTVTVKPAAEPLLLARPRGPEPEPLSVPLLVVGKAGQGRVAWFGGTKLWEWAFWEPPMGAETNAAQAGRRLLRNLLVWTATSEEPAGLSLVGQQLVYQEGERVRMEAQWTDPGGSPVTDQPLVLELESLSAPDTLPARTYSLEPIPGRPGHFAVVLPPLPPGSYLVRPRTADEPRISGRQEALVVTPHSLEATQVRQESRHLRHLAAGLGGSYVDGNAPDVADRLARALGQFSLLGDVRTVRRQWRIWAGWPLLGSVVLLLGLEWLLRRRQGLL